MAEGRKAGGSGKVDSKIMKCICSHAAQDAMYGSQNRVHRVIESGSTTEYKCTVCKPIRARERRDLYLRGISFASGRMS